MHRFPVLPALLAFALVLPPMVSAETIAEDASGDVQGDLETGESVPIPAGTMDHVDLTHLEVTESLESFTFTLGVVSRSPADALDGQIYQVGFRHYTTEFRLLVDVVAENPVLGGGAFVTLERRSVGSEQWDTDSSYPATLSSTSISIEIPRQALIDEQGTPPLPGRLLEDFWAQASNSLSERSVVGPVPSTGGVLHVEDVMPDQGTTDESFAVTQGQPPTGDVRVTSRFPDRTSNGEEATYVYSVTLNNTRTDTIAVVLEAQNVPDGWIVEFPVPGIEVPGNGELTVPVVVSTPFQHQHDTHEQFDIVAVDAEAGSPQGALALGIRYIHPPQPTGHHDELWVHARDADQTVPVLEQGRGLVVRSFMNTLPEDPNDTGATMGPSEYDSTAPDQYTWCTRLSPALAVGLDFNLNDQGTFLGELEANAPMNGDLSARLLVTSGTGGQPFTATTPCSSEPALEAIVSPMQTLALDGSSPVPFELPLDALADADFIPFDASQHLYLEFTFALDAPGPPSQVASAWLNPGAKLALPLDEYHDPVPESESISDLNIEVAGDYRVVRNPGSVATFTARVQGPDGPYNLDILGTKPSWAEIFPAPTVQSGDEFTVAVIVPEEAADGEVADLLIRAVGEDGGFALARAYVEVDTDSEHPDDAAQLQSLRDASQASPGPGVVALAIVAGLLAALRRQRQR